EDVGNFRVGEKFGNDRLIKAVGHMTMRNEFAAGSVGFNSARTGAHLFRKAGGFGIARTLLSVNVDGAGLRGVFQAVETGVGKKNAVLFCGFDVLKAVAARRTGLCGLFMNGKTVARRLVGGADVLGGFGRNGDDAKLSQVASSSFR